MREEFRQHMELRTQDLMRAGLASAAAMRQARAEFGSTERYHDEGRVSRGLRRIDDIRFSWLDFKLGFRMLARYPGLTIVGGLAMAFAIWVGAGTFELVTQWTHPRLPLDDGERIVGVQFWDMESQQVHSRVLHDFVAWREQLGSIRELSAFRTFESNLIIGESGGEPVKVAAMHASAFGVARERALLGRVFVETDEHPSAPSVIVIGYDIWQRRFEGDVDVIGRAVRLGNESHTVIGVMPERFEYPIAHDVWIPLRLNPLHFARGEGPALTVLGRLAPGVTLKEAQAELTTWGLRAAAEIPETHEYLRPRVMDYASSIEPRQPGLFAVALQANLIVFLLILLVCSNVALLLFARAAARESEIVVRNALGASRGHIITQLIAEALVLGSLGAALGLAAAGYGVRVGLFVIEMNVGRLPFWFHDSLSPATVLYALVLMAVGAALAGVLPALRVTRAIGERMRQASAGGGGLRFSGIWTFVIVAQVAVTVLFPVAVFLINRAKAPIESFDVGFASEEFLSVRLEYDGESMEFQSARQELERRLSADPAVAGVTFANRLPRMYHYLHRIDVVEDVTSPGDSIIGRSVHAAAIDIDYAAVLGAPVLDGRGFNSGDLESGHHVLIVNESFVHRILGGRNPIGRYVRFAESENQPGSTVEPGPWYEIVGVVKDLGMNYLGNTSPDDAAGVYHPLSPRTPRLYMAVKVRGDPAAFAPRALAMANAVDARLRLYDPIPMDELDNDVLRMISIYSRIALLVSSVALMLSLAGIYAVMSFAVSRRTREIGIRVALGAQAHRVMLAVFRRPLTQVALGVAAGGFLVYVVTRSVTNGLSAQEVGMVIVYTMLMLGVCMLACIVPAARALRVEPTVALRDDG
jgi:predicted permease